MRSRSVALAGAATSAFIAASVLFGWAIQNPYLVKWHPAFESTKANAALAIAILNIGIVALLVQPSARWLRAVAASSGGLMMFVGLFVFVEYALRFGPAVDEALATDWSRVGQPNPGRMSVYAALVLLFLGFSIVSHEIKNTWIQRSSTAATFGAVLIASVGMIGYVFSIPAPFAPWESREMALPTVVTLTLSSFAMLILRGERSFLMPFLGESASSRAARRLGAASLLGPLIIVWTKEWLVSYGGITSASGLALVVVLNAAFFLSVIWWNGKRLRTAELEIVRSHLELERRVHERTFQLENAIKELESFNYSVSHDLRTPLHSIRGFTQALLADPTLMGRTEGSHMMLQVKESADRMRQTIDALLKLSRVANMPLELRPVDLSEIARDVATRLADQETNRSIDFLIQPSLAALGDERLLRIVFENLFSNAMKFTRSRPRARIVFGLRTLGGANAFVVEDNGVGFSMTDGAKLFHPFQRLHAATEFDGTGIGLATVARIVQRHGGRVWAHGAPHRGASFFFMLPGGPSRPLAPAQPLVLEESVPRPTATPSIAASGAPTSA